MKTYSLYLIIFSVALSFLACQQSQTTSESVLEAASYEVVKSVATQEAVQMIDVVATLEGQLDSDVKEFSSGAWAIAVKNLNTGYTYYYDSSNNFLGRKK